MNTKTIISNVIAITALFVLMTDTAWAAKSKSTEGMVLIKAGCFTMGNSSAPADASHEHKVCLSNYYLDTHEVTQKDFIAIMKTNPSKFAGDDKKPIDNVKWAEANKYCKKIGKRLPSEAEWEYAAREGGKTLTFPGFDSRDELDASAWTDFNSNNEGPSPVGTKKPNSLGIYDMAGNVREWTMDWYAKDYYSTSPTQDPAGPANGPKKVVRGGSWCQDDIEVFKTFIREKQRPANLDYQVGFRCAQTP